MASDRTPDAANVLIYDDPAKLIADLANRWTGTRVRRLDDTVAPDGNTYIIQAQTPGELLLRDEVTFLREAVSELQDTVAAVAKVLVDAELVTPDA